MLATPAAAAATASVLEFDAAVRDDLAAVIHFAARKQVLDPAEAAALLDAFGALSAEPRLSSEFFWAYFASLEAIRAGQPGEARRVLLLLGNLLVDHHLLLDRELPELPTFRDDRGLPTVAGPKGCYLAAPDSTPAGLGPADRRAIAQQIRGTWLPAGVLNARTSTAVIDAQVRKYDAYTCELSGKSPGLDVLDPDRQTAALGLIAGRAAAAADLIGQLDPASAAEISALTEYVVLLHGSDFVGGSDIRLFGASFLRLSPEWSSLCYADHLVHEAAHQRLHAAHELAPLLRNKDQLGAPSPIRSDPRPLYGTLHATFVFLRLSQFMARALSNPVDGVSAAEAEIRFHRHLLGLLQGLRTIADYGELTPTGVTEIAEWQAVAADLLKVAGPPDERIFSKLDWDYERANPRLPAFLP